MSPRFLALLLALALCSIARAEEAVLIQGWEGKVDFNTWPEGAKAKLSTDWAAEGRQSLHIARGTMVVTGEMKTHDWIAHQLWRLHVRVPGNEGVMLGIELTDGEPGYLNRHQNSASAPPGESVVDVDISSALWRGEMNKPNRLVKRPLDKNNIRRMGITAQTGEIYVDRIELVKVKPLTTPGGFAFDFGRRGGLVQGQWTGIDPQAAWDEQKGYGITSGATAFSKDTPYPTPVMGDGIILNDAQFQVRLPGEEYIGWAIFERSGFWEGEQAAYAKVTLVANDKPIHAHQSNPADAWFLFEDLEVLTQDELIDKLILPRQQTAEIRFEAIKGTNTFKLQAEGILQHPPRLAGLVLAPDTVEGRAFIDAHKRLQRQTIAKVHQLIPKQERPGDPSRATSPLTISALETHAIVHPADFPTHGKPVTPMHAMAGIPVARLIGLYASREMTITATAPALVGDAGTIPASAVALMRNVYLPVHGFDQTACWIESHHYKPLDSMRAGPRLARALLVTIDIPQDCKPGAYRGDLAITCSDPASSAKIHQTTIPLTIVVHPGKLPPLDIPNGLFFSAPPIPKAIAGDELYWKGSESMLRQLRRASFTMITGGPDYSYRWSGKTAVFSGDDAVRMIELARRHGLATKVTNYGGLSPGFGTRPIRPAQGMSLQETYDALHAGWEKFRTERNLPEHYLYAYDEPGTPDELKVVTDNVKMLRRAGFKTIGYTSMQDPARADEHHLTLARETAAPAFNIHSPATLRFVKDEGNEPWLYNQGLWRHASGLDLWRAHRYGAAGRLQWIGSIVQGFQYDTLDGREPDPSCFFLHRSHGVLIAPRYLCAMEGGIDARLLFELERRAAANTPGAPAIRAFLAELEAKPYRKEMEWETLEALRLRMLELLAAPR